MGRSGAHGELHGGRGQESRRGAQGRGARQIKINDAVTGAALVGLAALVLWHIQGFPAMPGQKFGPAWFPGLAAAGLGICGALLVAEGLRNRAPLYALPPWIGRARPRRAVAAMVTGLVAYILLSGTLGFHFTAFLVLVLWLRTLGARWPMTISVALVATVVIHLAFYKLLRVPLPWGVLERWAF